MESVEDFIEINCASISCNLDKDFISGIITWYLSYLSLNPVFNIEDIEKISLNLARCFKARKDFLQDKFYEKFIFSIKENNNIIFSDQDTIYFNIIVKHHSKVFSYLSTTFSNLTNIEYITFCKIYEEIKSIIKDELNVIISDQNVKYTQ